MINKAQLTKLQNKSDKSQVKPETGRITPLSPNSALNKTDNTLKELRRPRSRKYIKNLMELRELLLQLEYYRKNQAAEIQYGTGNVNDGSKYGRNNTDNGSKIGRDNGNDELKYGTNHGNNKTEYDKDNEMAGDSSVREWRDESFAGRTFSESGQTDFRTADMDVYSDEPVRESEINSYEEINRISVADPVIEDLERQIEEKLKQLGEENPMISRLIALMYMSDKEEYLIKCGVINGSGTTMYSREDATAAAMNTEEAERLKRGYDILLTEEKNPNFLTLEVYTDAYCVIFMDGIVKTID